MSLPHTVSKGKLKEKMLEYFRELERTGGELIVTDHRVPVLVITPLKKKGKSVDEIFKSHRGKVKYFEDLTAPTESEWEEK